MKFETQKITHSDTALFADGKQIAVLKYISNHAAVKKLLELANGGAK